MFLASMAPIGKRMADHATFLHVTDAHVSASGVSFERDDHKVDVPEIPSGTRETALELLFRRRHCARERPTQGVLCSITAVLATLC